MERLGFRSVAENPLPIRMEVPHASRSAPRSRATRHHALAHFVQAELKTKWLARAPKYHLTVKKARSKRSKTTAL
jgi:hypothetical protein